MAAKPDPQIEAQAALQRLTSMGIEARLMEGGRCVLARMRLQAVAFESLNGVTSIEQVVFSTLGRDRIKCLRPRSLFQLPTIPILDCRDSTAVEARIRLEWKKHITEMKETRTWLESIGARPEVAEEGSILTFPIEGESRRARASMIDSHEVILPGQGKLSGIALQRPEDRCLPIDRTARSHVELEIAVSTRLEELIRMDKRLGDERRRAALAHSPGDTVELKESRPGRLLLVGPRISRQRQCIESLRLRGYEVDVAYNEHEGLEAYNYRSPELVLADMNMGRNEGTSFVLTLRQLAGIEEIPVILVDETRRKSSRVAAQRVGAAGYLIYPIDVPRISDKLLSLVNDPRRRRYTRYRRRLPVRIEQASHPCMVTTLSRGGMFIATDDNLQTHTLQRCHVSLPEAGATVSCEAEVRYRRGTVGRERGGVGVRFRTFAGSDENILINYLRGIEESTNNPA